MKTELDRDLWDRIASVFDRALDVSGPDRSSLLTQMCGSDHTVRREVEAMLEAHERGTGLMAERRLTPGAIERRRIEATLPPGSRVGPYRVEALVGAGGMGDVYRAARADGAYRQTVALKLLRPGYAAAEMVRRFRIEREALARLVHPGIATILISGAASGVPEEIESQVATWVRKPFEMGEVLDAMSRLLEARRESLAATCGLESVG